MDFLKNLFGDGEALTYDQLLAKVQEAKLKVADLSGGAYVSKDKHDTKVGALEQQVKDLQGQITTRDGDLADLNTKLAAALADAGKLPEIQKALETLQGQYTTEKANYEARLQKQAYEHLVREKASGLRFSSNSAKKAFIAEAIAKEFAMDGENLTGYDDFLSEYQTSDPGAFVAEAKAEATQEPAPSVVLPTGGAAPSQKRSLSDWMKLANENPNTVVDFGK